jgi:hypothetical protein
MHGFPAMIDRLARRLRPTCRFGWRLAITSLIATGAVSAQSSAQLPTDYSERLTRLLEELRGSPVVDIIGVVDAPGVRAGMSRGEQKWNLILQLPVWRYAGQPLRREQLTIRQFVDKAEYESMRASMPAYRVVRLRAHVAETNAMNRPEALLVEVVDADATDAELARAAIDLQKPVTFDDPVLGHLTFDRSIRIYQGNATWHRQTVRVVVPAHSDAERDDALATARTLFDAQSEWDRRVRTLVIEKLLPLKNDVWLQDDESKFTATSFEARIHLQSIHIEREGRVEFWYSDGDMFGGHSIQVRGTLSDGPLSADLAG